jgi:hypothetical protein
MKKPTVAYCSVEKLDQLPVFRTANISLGYCESHKSELQIQLRIGNFAAELKLRTNTLDSWLLF